MKITKLRPTKSAKWRKIDKKREKLKRDERQVQSSIVFTFGICNYSRILHITSFYVIILHYTSFI